MYEVTITLIVPDREQAAFQLSQVNYEVMTTIHNASLSADGKALFQFPDSNLKRTEKPWRTVQVNKLSPTNN